MTARRGSVVLVALCLVTVLAIAVVGYFSLCMRTMELSNRSYCYTASVQLADIGMSEALWALDQQLNSSSFNWTSYGWTTAYVGGVHTATKTLAGFATNVGLKGSVKITVQYYDTSTPFTQPPIITSDGITPLPDGTQIDKQLKAMVKPAALFTSALASTAPPSAPAQNYWPYLGGYVTFLNDSSVSIDSYDSTVNGGNYTPTLPPPLPLNRSDQAIICGPYLNLANANILGYAMTANPSATLPTFSGGSLKGFSSPSGTTVDYSRISNNGVQRTFAIVAPPRVMPLPTSGSIGPKSDGSCAYYYYSGSDYQIAPSSTLSVTGPVTIYVQNSFYVWGTLRIDSNSTGPVQIYVGGSADVNPQYSGDSGIDNRTKNPAMLAIAGPASGNDFYLIQSNPFYGVIYLPKSDVWLYGTWQQNPVKVFGSVVGYHVISYFSNPTQVHYDLNLRKTTFSLFNTPYEVVEWINN